MKLRRTANAGILLEMDGVSILLDGVCGEVVPYLKTPDAIKSELCERLPDAVAFTHKHLDHYDESYAEYYKNMSFRSVFGPESLYSGKMGEVDVTAVETRHIGKSDVDHCSFVLQGSKCVWFMGDASPNELKKLRGFPAPDVLIVPYAYAITEFAWKTTKDLEARTVVIVHLPDKANDPYCLWNEVGKFTESEEYVYIPDMDETIVF